MVAFKTKKDWSETKALATSTPTPEEDRSGSAQGKKPSKTSGVAPEPC
jgi:hypothetical protein